MYTVLQRCTDGDSVLYAVTDSAPDSEVEFVSADDLKLLSIVGLQMQTSKGEPVSVDGDTLICDVPEFEPEPEPDESEDDIYSMYSDEDEPTEEEASEEEAEEDPYDGVDVYGAEGEEEAESEDDDADFDLYDGYDIEDDTPESSVVSKLYDMLTPDQITVLRRYYLWFSQRLFSDAQKGGLSGFKSKNQPAAIRKSATLKQLRQGGDYRYAGFLDTGSKYAGYTCSLGHPLRFMHLAWDITVGDIDTAFFGQNYDANYEAVIQSNNCIAFGIQCIGDFFEVDQECIKSLQRAQRDSLKDMALLYSIYTTQDVQRVSHSFDLLDEILKVTDKYDMKLKMFKNAEPTIPFSVSSFYHQFRSVGLIPPKSLVQEIRSCLVGWTDGRRYFSNSWTGFLKAPDTSFYARLKVIAGKRYDGVVDALAKRGATFGRSMNYGLGLSRLWAFVYLMFTYELCGYYKYTATKDGFHDEGGYNKSSVGWEFPNLYKNSLHKSFSGFDFNLNSMRGLFDLTNLCMEARTKYADRNISFKLPYFSMGKCYEEDIKSNRYGLSSVLRNMIKGYGQEGGDSDKALKSIDFMLNVIFVNEDVLTALTVLGVVKHRPEFKDCLQADKSIDLQAVCAVLQTRMAEFDFIYSGLKLYCEGKATADEREYQRKKEEEEKKRREEKERKRREEEERRRREEEFKRGDERLKAIEREVDQSRLANMPAPTTTKGVVEYLQLADLSAVTDRKFDFAKKVLDTLSKSGKEPSPRQFQYIQPLYEEISGVAYSGEGKIAPKVNLSDRQDIQDAIAWVEAHEIRSKAIAAELGVEDFKLLTGVLSSIKRYGTISEKQMKHAEMAVAIMNRDKM